MNINNKLISILIVLLFCTEYDVLAQNKPAKFGFELEATPFKMDNFSEKKLFSLSGYIGFFSEISFSKQFITKFSAGLHNIYFQKYTPNTNASNTIKFAPLKNNNKGGVPSENDFMNTIQLTIEPRFYLFYNTKSWGNCYTSLPISIETAPLNGFSKGNVKMTILPTLGYRYNLSEHWIFEVDGGLGWGKTLQKKRYSLFEYTLQARIGYTF